jgi:hypothetical protein
MSTWKYALIKVGEDEDGPVCEMGEVYENAENGSRSFCLCSPHSLDALRTAMQDIERDGVDERWFNEGTFSWVTVPDGGWVYEPGPNAPPQVWKNDTPDEDDIPTEEP